MWLATLSCAALCSRGCKIDAEFLSFPQSLALKSGFFCLLHTYYTAIQTPWLLILASTLRKCKLGIKREIYINSINSNQVCCGLPCLCRIAPAFSVVCNLLGIRARHVALVSKYVSQSFYASAQCGAQSLQEVKEFSVSWRSSWQGIQLNDVRIKESLCSKTPWSSRLIAKMMKLFGV